MTRHNPADIRSKSPSDPFHQVLGDRLSRRSLLTGAAAAIGASAIAPGFVGSIFGGEAMAASSPSTLTFGELKRVYDQTHHIAEGYRADILMRWGDKVAGDAPDFDIGAQSAASAAKQFGYNNDFVAYLPLPLGSQSSDRGLLYANHEYPNPHIMFPGLITTEDDSGKAVSAEQVAIEMASMGASIVEIANESGVWKAVPGSAMNRRIDLNTEMRIAGPAAGHALMKTAADPTGTKAIGTGSNCGGGMTPWGTVLTCEEFAYEFFAGEAAKTPFKDHVERIGYEASDYYGIARFHDRFNIEKEPNEFNRFQWVVEIDPYDPASVPVKRTALGRFGHEGSTVVVNKDGRVVVYMGDDDHMEYLYRFVSKGAFSATDRAANSALLDDGDLAVAKFEADGTLNWLPLTHGQGPLTADKGFADQGEVLIKARQAGDALGATPMDRPEDFEANPVTGRVYAVMTKSAKRKPETVNAANTRPENKWGHIVELIPPGAGKDADHAAAQYKWDILILCGDPAKPETGAMFHPETSADGFFMTPDNIAFDPKGRMWVATDGMNAFDLADGIFGVDTDGPGRALPRSLFSAPSGAECTGPAFTPDGKTMFVAVQHPGENSDNIDKLTTRWPDFKDGMPPRPSVVAITRADGGEIGG
jgi:uncharacterized protein